MKYQPACTITPEIVNLVAEIGETIGLYAVPVEQNLTPSLRREKPSPLCAALGPGMLWMGWRCGN